MHHHETTKGNKMTNQELTELAEVYAYCAHEDRAKTRTSILAIRDVLTLVQDLTERELFVFGKP